MWSAVVSPRARRALLTVERYERDDRGKRTDDGEDLHQAIWVDLENKRVISTFELASGLNANAIHPSGDLAVMRGSAAKYPMMETLCLVRFSAAGAASMQRWIPLQGTYRDGKKWTNRVHWVDFVGDDYLAMLSPRGALHLWTLSDLRQVATFGDGRGLPCVTPDGRQIALATKRGVALIDPAQQRVVAFQPIAEMPREPTLAFDHSGRTLTIVDKTQTILVDTQTRNQTTMHTAYIDKGSHYSRPDVGWVDGYLCSRSNLIDLDLGITVWGFDGALWASPESNYLWAVVKSRDQLRHSLRSYSVSTPAIAEKVNQVLAGSEALSWRPGNSVRIDVSGLPAERQAAAKQGLTERLIDQGFIPSNHSDLVLKATILENRKDKKAVYRMNDGERRWDQTYEYQSRSARLEIIKSGKSIWSKTKSSLPPPMIRGDQSSIDDRMSRIGEPWYGMYEKVSLPKFIRTGRSGPLVTTRFIGD